ncbi:MAG: hypothetical protein A4S09_12305 [Proteobacteria bacterium SG_bin7]|nr:MAG: hypothetical protein A4S09_12305 [Proteobacteria bacterium SG_bin7]
MKSRPKSLIVISIVSILMVNYNNCGSNVQFSPKTELGSNLQDGNVDPGSPVPPPPSTPDDDLLVVQKTCMNSTPVVEEITIRYINPENLSCEFGKGDNLPAKDGYFQGHIDQAYNFSLPAGSTLCGMNFEFPTQAMRYDDHVLLTFNDIVISGTFDFSADFDKKLGMNVYSWAKIRGSSWSSRKHLEGNFCEGQKDGKSSCSWPTTDTVGSIQMSFDGSVFQKIMALDTTRKDHSFHLITLGDNDANDCEISPISFKVKVSYVK